MATDITTLEACNTAVGAQGIICNEWYEFPIIMAMILIGAAIAYSIVIYADHKWCK